MISILLWFTNIGKYKILIYSSESVYNLFENKFVKINIIRSS